MQEGSAAADTLHEMQCMWFLLESAALYRRTGQYGEALKKCHEIGRVSEADVDLGLEELLCSTKERKRNQTRESYYWKGYPIETLFANASVF